MEELCCVSSALRGADDCTVTYRNEQKISGCQLLSELLGRTFLTCCYGPHQRHQAHLDWTTPAPDDKHHPQWLTDHQALIQRCGLNHADKFRLVLKAETEVP